MRNFGNAGMRFGKSFFRQYSSSASTPEKSDHLASVVGFSTATFVGCMATCYLMSETKQTSIAIQTDLKIVLENQAKIMDSLRSLEGTRHSSAER